MRRFIVRIQAAIHELRCAECRVTWYSWLLRLLFIGGMKPMAKNWRRSPERGR